jgi:polysaccharide deacetylase family protein (PEP-CTERM system associated)
LEDWYQVLYFEGHVSRDEWYKQENRLEASTDKLLDLLDEHQTRATFFVLAWNAERTPRLVEKIYNRGHEIASHGFAHELIYRQGPDGFAQDLGRSLRVLRQITGQPVKGYRAPSFSITRESTWAFSILMDYGIEYDSSVLPARRPYCGIPDAPRGPWRLFRNDGRSLIELPPSTVSILNRNLPFSGGGYFRLLPYRLVHWGISRSNRVGLPALC